MRTTWTREHRLALVDGHRGQLDGGADDVNVVPSRSQVGFDDQRALLEMRQQFVGVGGDVRGGDGNPTRLEDAAGDDLVVQRSGGGVRVQNRGAQLVQRPGEAEREPAELPQHIEIVFHSEGREVDGAARRMHDVHHGAHLHERLCHERPVTAAAR